MMEDDWKASGWLGIILAGKKWTPLFSQFESGIEALVSEIKHQAPSLIPVPEGAGSNGRRRWPSSGAQGGRYGGTDARGSIESWGEDVNDVESVFSRQEMREELDRLRHDIGIKANGGKGGDDGGGGGGGGGSSSTSSVTNSRTPSLKCAIPAAVPDNPSFLLVTDPMRQLVKAVLAGTRGDLLAGTTSAYATQQVGFVGMGGVGQ